MTLLFSALIIVLFISVSNLINFFILKINKLHDNQKNLTIFFLFFLFYQNNFIYICKHKRIKNKTKWKTK